MRFVANRINSVHLTAILQNITCSRIDAAVAYVTWADDFIEFCREKNLALSLFCLCNPTHVPSPAVVQKFIDGPASWSLWLTKDHFHPKLIWFRDRGIYIGSANLTRAAWYSNVEAGLYIDAEEPEYGEIEPQIAAFFEAVKARSRLASKEDYTAIVAFAKTRAPAQAEVDKLLASEFEKKFATVPGGDSPIAVARQHDPSREAFVREWSGGLEILRKVQTTLAEKHKKYGRRWVPARTPLAVEVDQVLNLFYETHIAKAEAGIGLEIEALHARNQAAPGKALDAVLEEWCTSVTPEWIRKVVEHWAPFLRGALSPERLEVMDDVGWREICGKSFAIHTVARQLPNAVLGKPPGTSTDLPERIEWFANFTWVQQTQGGRGIAEVLRFVLWDDSRHPADRLWTAITDPAWKFPRIGISILGELIGWARPDEFPPRNNRVSRALYALGVDVQRYGG